MVRYRAKVVLLAALLSMGSLHEARPESIRQKLSELDRKLADLDAGFRETMDRIFYEPRHYLGAESPTFLANWQEKCLLTEIGALEVLYYKRERKALLLAKHLLERYFINTTPDSDKWPRKTRSFSDYIISRSIQRAYETELAEEQDRRKKVFAIFERFHQHFPIVELSRQYFLRAKDRVTITAKARASTEEALQRFRADVSTEELPAREAADLLNSVDDLITELGHLFDGDRLPEPTQQVARDIARMEEQHRALRTSVTLAAPTRQEMIELDRDVERVRLEHIIDHENALVQSSFDDIIMDLDNELSELEGEFELTIRDIFHEILQLAEASEDSLLMALSARMAQSIGMMYASETRTMLIAIQFFNEYFIDKIKQLPECLVPNESLFEYVMNRFSVYALDTGFMHMIVDRKEIYMMLEQFDDREQMHLLAQHYKEYIQEKKEAYTEADKACLKSLRRYNRDVTLVLSATQVSQVLKTIDDLIDQAVSQADLILLPEEQWMQLGNSIPLFLLKRFIGYDLFERISVARAYFAIDAAQVESVDMRDVLARGL